MPALIAILDVSNRGILVVMEINTQLAQIREYLSRTEILRGYL